LKIKITKQVWSVSTNGILHLWKDGHYMCNGAVGARKRRVDDHEEYNSIKCKNCLKWYVE